MLTISWILVLAGLTWFFGNHEEQRYNPNNELPGDSQSETREVTLTRNAYNHYVASGKINGVDVTFMLDTGATHVAIPSHLMHKLHLKPGSPSIVSTANGRVEVRNTDIASLQLGPIHLKNIRAALNPGMRDNEILLGMSALKQLEFTQSGNQLTLKQY